MQLGTLSCGNSGRGSPKEEGGIFAPFLLPPEGGDPVSVSVPPKYCPLQRERKEHLTRVRVKSVLGEGQTFSKRKKRF